jgi:hypothetical protein
VTFGDCSLLYDKIPSPFEHGCNKVVEGPQDAMDRRAMMELAATSDVRAIRWRRDVESLYNWPRNFCRVFPEPRRTACDLLGDQFSNFLPRNFDDTTSTSLRTRTFLRGTCWYWLRDGKDPMMEAAATEKPIGNVP